MRSNGVSRGSFPLWLSSSAVVALGCVSAGCTGSTNDAQRAAGGDTASDGSASAAASGGANSGDPAASVGGDTVGGSSAGGSTTTSISVGRRTMASISGDGMAASISGGGSTSTSMPAGGSAPAGSPADGDIAASGSSAGGSTTTSNSAGGSSASNSAGGTTTSSSTGGAAGGSATTRISAGGSATNSAGGTTASNSAGGTKASNSVGGSSANNSAGAGGTSSGGVTSGTARGGAGSGGAGSGGAGSGGAGSGGAATSSGGKTGQGGSTAKCEPTGQIPSGAPTLKVGVWTDITPPGIVKGDAQTCIGQGLALDPCNTGTLYWGTTPYDESKGGLYKSTNGGGTWTKIGQLDEPVHVRVDPKNPSHLYAGDGVRGNTMGFWVSWDGGNNWAKPAGWTNLAQTQKLTIDDVYDIAVDPADFNHIVVSSHSPYDWDSATYGEAAGVLESKDGGDSWVVHKPKLTWGAGHSIDFLYEPSLGIGDANTWLLGTQENGIWRTTDAGANWTQVSTTSIAHGGDDIYYTKAGVLYAGSNSGILRSTDNGKSWTTVKDSGAYSTVRGDGNLLYTGICWGSGATPFLTSPETDGSTWTPFNNGAQTFVDGGPFEIAFDKQNNILYASLWMQGIWAMKIK